MNRFVDFISVFIATGLGSGFSPKAPGTSGTLVGMMIWFYLNPFITSLTLLMQVVFYLVIFLLGWWATFHFCKKTKTQDPSRVVIDEILGVWIPLFWFQLTSLNFLLFIFCTFRLFDVLKPYPISIFDRAGKKIPIGLAQSFLVIADDLLAGIFAGFLWWIISFTL